MAKYAARYQGLHNIYTYDGSLSYFESDGGAGIYIKRPDRTASFIRASPQYKN